MKDFKKQICHYNIIPSDFSKWVFLEQTETVFDELEIVFDETKTISQWTRCSRRNEIAPTGHKCIENLEPETLSNFQQHLL